MKKTPSLFKRNYEGDRLIRNEVVEGCEWVLAGEGVATEKFDGTSCLLQDSLYFKRYEVKNGKTPPDGFMPAQDPDPVTGDVPGWVPVMAADPASKWHIEGLENAIDTEYFIADGTYELVGPKVQGNPYKLLMHVLWAHGAGVIDGSYSDLPVPPRDFDGLREYLQTHEIEGIVFHHPDGRMCKIKRRDFGFPWPVKS